MALVLKEFTLDIVPKKAPQIIDVSENDINRDYKINLTNDGATYTIPSGTSATIEGTIDKENGFSQDAIVSSNAILFSLTEEMTAKRGRFWTKVKLMKDNKPLSTCGFWLNVDRAGINSEALVNLTGFEKVLQKKFEDYIDEHGTAAPDAGVNSVNGKAGVVTLRLSDIENDMGTTTVQTFEDLYNTTAEEVTVLKDDSYYGSGETVTFMVARNLYDGEKQVMDGGYGTPGTSGYIDYFSFLKRENGDYMVPKPRDGSVAAPVPAAQIGEVIQSYFNHPELVYGSIGTAFTPLSDDPERDPTQNPHIDCSCFASLVAQAISYENSRYVTENEENILGRYAGLNTPRNPRTKIGDGTSNKYNYGASEMAMYYAQQNRLFYIDYDREHPVSQLQVGDLIFYSHAFKYTADSADLRRRYLHIGHVAIVLGVYPESDTIQIAEVGTPQGERYFQPISRVISGSDIHRDVNIATSKIFDFTARPGVTDATSGQDDGWGDIVYARPIYPELEQEFEQILESADFYKDVASPVGAGNQSVLAKLHFSKPLAPNKIYTLVAEGDLPNDPEQNDRLVIRYYATGTSGGAAIYQRINQLNKYGNKVSYVFVPPENIADMTNIYVSVFRPSDSAAADSNVYNLKKIAVYEGICPGAPAVVDSREIEVIYHHWNHTGDTSWILIKLPRHLYRLSFHNCSGNDEDNPETKISNPKAWLESHTDYFLAHNFSFSGDSNVSWGYRWNGVEVYPSTTKPLKYTRPRNFFAVDTDAEEFAFYNSCTLPVSGETDEEKTASVQARYAEAGDVLNSIPAKYDTVFACGDWLIQNGTARTSSYTNDNGTFPRTCFGWDNEYYYIFSCEGRGTYERGLYLDEVKDIFVANNVANAIVFDGGGSVCFAARINNNVERINRFRDASLTYPALRAVGLCACYKRRDVQ